MPKRLPLAVPGPEDVHVATQAFGSELRVHLIRHYGQTPSRQADAARALGVERAVVQFNTKALVDCGVLERRTDRRHWVNHARVTELLALLQEFITADGANRTAEEGTATP